jgi:hypothetical protein
VNLRRLRYKVSKSVEPFDLVRVTKEKINKKAQKLIFHRVPGDPYSGGISIKFGIFGDVTNLINRSKFRIDRHRGLNSTSGSKIACSHRKCKTSRP